MRSLSVSACARLAIIMALLSGVCGADEKVNRAEGQSTAVALAADRNDARAGSIKFQIKVDRGADVGQSFGSLFEVTSEDGSLTIGAGFQNAYNTRYRADRHAVQFFIRPADGDRTLVEEKLPRPNDLCGTYLYSRDEVIHSTYGGHKSWDVKTRQWESEANLGGTDETMRVGADMLEFGESTVRYAGRTILEKPAIGRYELFFYADGYLCFYHVNRRDKPYRPYVNDEDGYSKLYACPWTPAQPSADLSQAIVLTLPVVGETTFAWGQLGTQILTGSNIGGFYVLENARWKKLLEPNIGVSYQLYSSMIFRDRLLMGQYPTGRLFAYDGHTIGDQPGWPPLLHGVTSTAREAQTSVIYGGEMFVGVWPWGELWRYHPAKGTWHFQQRMFDHPALSETIVHPYDVENRQNDVSNLWGQRVTSLVTSGDSLYVSTSAKYPAEWQPDRYPFLADDKWKSYGAVYRLTLPGHLAASTKWTTGTTQFEFTIDENEMAIAQDGQQLATAKLSGPLSKEISHRSKLAAVRWREGIYGQFRGLDLQGTLLESPSAQ